MPLDDTLKAATLERHAEEVAEEIALLDATRDLIASPANWTRGAWSRRRPFRHQEYCLIGGLAHVLGVHPDTILNGQAVAAASRVHARLLRLTHCCVEEFNDKHSHAEVLALLAQAREACERDL